jgi:RNA polymerase sigma-70 factor (ECF subfamily)
MEVDRAEQRQVMERFLAALTSGDVQGLMDALAPDAVLIADGGGFATAVRQPISGAKLIVAFLRNFPRFAEGTEVRVVWINGAPALRMDGPDPVGTSAISMVVEDGRITRLFAMRNPYKLERIDEEVVLGR